MREMLVTLEWDNGTERIVIPKGFRTDLYSVRFLGKLITPDIVEQQGPAILHDWCYTIQSLSRAQSDALLLDAMHVVGVGFIKRWSIYLAVCAGGWVAWNRNDHALRTDPRGWFEYHGIYRPEFHTPTAEIDRVDV